MKEALFNCIKKLHPKIKMYIDAEYILFGEVDEMLITEVNEIIYNNPRLENISGTEWAVVEEFNYMTVRVV